MAEDHLAAIRVRHGGLTNRPELKKTKGLLFQRVEQALYIGDAFRRVGDVAQHGHVPLPRAEGVLHQIDQRWKLGWVVLLTAQHEPGHADDRVGFVSRRIA